MLYAFWQLINYMVSQKKRHLPSVVTTHDTIAMLWVGHVVELKGKDVWCYSDEMESVNLRKCPYDHQLTNKAYLGTVTITSIFQSFTYKMAAKTRWHRYGTKLRYGHPVYK